MFIKPTEYQMNLFALYVQPNKVTIFEIENL